MINQIAEAQSSMDIDEASRSDNAEKTRIKAVTEYPGEKWELSEPGIYIAKNRLPKSTDQLNVLAKELIQARLLVARGSTVYLLPENADPAKKKEKHPDAIVDGDIWEFKTVTGGLPKVVKRYKEAREKSEHIFLKIDAPHTRHHITRSLSGFIGKKGFTGGIVLVYFTDTGEFCQWTEAELGQKNPPLARRRHPGNNGQAATSPMIIV
jgi:hypothetical protein